MLTWYRMFLDKLVVANTASDSFKDWLSGSLRYNPTIQYGVYPNLLPMATAFDEVQRARGNPRRVWPQLPATLIELRLGVLESSLKALNSLEKNFDEFEYPDAYVAVVLGNIKSMSTSYNWVTR